MVGRGVSHQLGRLPLMTSMDVDRAIAGIARRQHGVFSHAQVGVVGGTDRIIHSRLASGRWLLLAPAVYALPSHPASWHRNLMASVIGESMAVVGGTSAAALHGLTGFRRGRATVVVPRGSNHRSPLAVVSERSDFRSTVVDAIPVLTVCDTLYNVAATTTGATLAIALDDALQDRAVTLVELQERYLDFAGSRRRGLVLMRRLLAARSHDAFVPPSSTLERLLYGVLDLPGMPRYQAQAPLPWAPGTRVDAMLLDAPVIVEGDGRRWHTRVADFERDRERDRAAAVHGYRTVRYTWDDLRRQPDRVAAEIRALVMAAA